MFFPLTPWVRILLIVNVAAFLAAGANPMLFRLGMFVPVEVLARPWSLISYAFLHGGFTHLLFNMIGLFFFGPRLEERLGSRGFVMLYTISAMGGALLSFTSPFTPVVGASGAVFGILYGFARYWPRENIYIWGVLPVEARWLIAFLVLSSLISGFSGRADGIAHFAHLGGFAAAWGYLKWRDKKNKVRKVEKPNSQYKAPGVLDVEARHRWIHMDVEALHEINRTEVEQLLRKLKEVGVRNMSEEEKSFLDRMADAARSRR